MQLPLGMQKLLMLMVVASCSASPGDDTPIGDDVAIDAGSAAADTYVLHCDSLFSARVVEKMAELDATFPLDCAEPLRADIGTLVAGPTPRAMCAKNETANACRTRLYDSPPDPTTLRRACTGTNCLRAIWIPRCADGSESCAEPEAICPDGTRAMALVEPAAVPSNRWLVYTSGDGGPCLGDSCWPMYRYSRTNNDQVFEQTMSSSHPDYGPLGARPGAGITNGGATSPFAAFNRVELKRCADPASNGMEVVVVGDGVPPLWAANYPGAPKVTRTSHIPTRHRGLAIHRALLHVLASPAGRDLDGNGTADIASFADATQVAFAGSSDAASYYVMAADALGETARTIAPTVDVRLVVDGKFDPSLDSEGRYSASPPASFSIYTSPYDQTHQCGPLPDNNDGMANESCSDGTWLAGPGVDGRPTWYDGFAARGSPNDASCAAMHGDSAACANDFHVIANHLASPVFILADQEDSLLSAHAALADHYTYRWPTITEFRKRVLAQAHDMEQHWANREETTPASNLALLLRKQRRNNDPPSAAAHTHLGLDDRMLRWSMTKCQLALPIVTRTTAQMLVAWLDNTSTDPIVIEDASVSSTTFWVTGTSCRAPE